MLISQVILVNTTTYLDSVAVYECGLDYWLDGPKQRQCQENSQWSGLQPVCRRKFIFYQ